MQQLRTTTLYKNTKPDKYIKEANEFLRLHNCGWQIDNSGYTGFRNKPILTGPEWRKSISSTNFTKSRDVTLYFLEEYEYKSLHKQIASLWGNTLHTVNALYVVETDLYAYWADSKERFTKSKSGVKKYDQWLPQPAWTLLHELGHLLLDMNAQAFHDLLDTKGLAHICRLIGDKLQNNTQVKGIDWNNDEDILTRTLVGEYGIGTDTEMFAVGCVIRNRALNRPGFASTIRGVCLQPWQFSCWDHNTPDRTRLINLNREHESYQRANKVAKRVLAGEPDITRNADHYLNIKVTEELYGKIPTWVDPSRKTVDLGEHTFYNLQGDWVEDREATPKEPSIYRELGLVAFGRYVQGKLSQFELVSLLKILIKLKHAN